VVLVKGEVHVCRQRDGKFQEIRDPDQTGLEFEVFIYCWLVHGAALSVGIDDLYLTLNGANGSRRIAEPVAGDLKSWHLREAERASEKESDGSAGTIRTAPLGLAELDTPAPLEYGAPREGWLHFRVRKCLPLRIEDWIAGAFSLGYVFPRVCGCREQSAALARKRLAHSRKQPI
jgi:hypothetical protein